jgi:hypothetical protein
VRYRPSAPHCFPAAWRAESKCCGDPQRLGSASRAYLPLPGVKRSGSDRSRNPDRL